MPKDPFDKPDGQEQLVKPTSRFMPWHSTILADWDIAVANHYRVAGVRFLFVLLTNGARCVKHEGIDNSEFWHDLEQQVRDSQTPD